MGDQPSRDRAGNGVCVTRDIHTGAGRERIRRSVRAEACFWRVGRQDRHCQYQRLYRPPDGCGDRRRRGDQGARDKCGSTGAKLQGGRSRSRQAQFVKGRGVPRSLCVEIGRGFWLADRDVADPMAGDFPERPQLPTRGDIPQLNGIATAQRHLAVGAEGDGTDFV